jgi:hypothetical protein
MFTTKCHADKVHTSTLRLPKIHYDILEKEMNNEDNSLP